MTITAVPVDGIGEVRHGDDIAAIIAARTTLFDGDVVVVTSKIISKADGLSTTQPRDEVLRSQTDRVVAQRGAVAIVRTTHGLTLAAAGVDASNTTAGTLLMLPPDPDRSARSIRAGLLERTGRTVAVVVSDTAGRPWREGQTDIAIGAAGLVPLESFVGRTDTEGNPLMVTAPAVADELTGTAELASGKLGGRPVVVIRGLPAHLLTTEDGPGAAALQRSENDDLFGLGARDAVLAANRSGGSTLRGFPGPDGTVAELVELAGVPRGVNAKPSGESVEITVDDADASPHTWAEAGALRQRIEALATAHARPLSVRLVLRDEPAGRDP